MSIEAVTMHNDDKPKNPHYENDIRYTLEMCRWYLKPMGLWCMVYDDTSTWEKIVSASLILWYSFVSLFSIIPPLLCMFTEKKMLGKIKTFGMVGSCLSASIKFLYLCQKRRPLRNCIMQVERDWKAVEDLGYRATMLKQVSISRHLIALSATMFYLSGLILHIAIPLVVKIMFKGNVTVKPAAYLGYDFVLDSEFSYAHELIMSIQLISGLIKYTVTSCAYSLTTTFIAHVIGQIQTQISRLDYYVTNLQSKRRDPLGIIIRDHVAVLRFSKNMQESMCEIYLVQITEATLLLCALAYCFLLEWEEKDMVTLGTYGLMLISYTFNIFTFCYVGEILTDQFSQIGPVVYNIEWYNLPPKQAYNLIMLCVISLYPPKLTAGKMISLSMNTFSSVMQTAVVYMNLLRNKSDW